MLVVREVEALGAFQGGALVPTMGALHAGHLALVRRAGELVRQAGAARRPVVVSVFVNPTQFGPAEDYRRYPRSLEADVAAAEGAGADVLFAPSVETMYPPDQKVPVPPLPAAATEPGLEDACRPGHFAGVAQAVARLLDLARPRWAVFGEKDYQQLLVIAAMVRGQRRRWPELAIVPHETVREPDGLAMSSRNAQLAGESRRRARGLFRALQAARAAPDAEAGGRAMAGVLAAGGLKADYAVVRDAETLGEVRGGARPARALVAVRLGPVRLIDNMACPAMACGGTGV